MTGSSATTQEPNLSADYPGMVTVFPDGMTEIVMALIGVQSSSSESEAARVVFEQLAGLLATGGDETDGAPISVERARYADSADHDNQIVIAYWTSATAYRTWWESSAVQTWWRHLPSDPDSDVAVWKEVLTTTEDRHQYATGQTSPAGPSRFLPLRPSDKFGFWGAYRARLAVSATDPLSSSLERLPQPTKQDTKGRRVSVALPAGICYIREGQTWDECGPDELNLWRSDMEPVIGDWVAALGEDPVSTGCASIRFCRELDPATGEPLDRQSQFAFLLSLTHIERAARTNPVHLAVRNKFIDMYTEPTFTPTMNIWVEVHVPEPGGVSAEYVNCHSQTGFLPFVEITDDGVGTIRPGG